jgi:HSP20 family protein
MGKLVDQLHKGYYNFYPSETWTPNVNLFETDNVYLVCVDLSGVEKDKIELTVDGQRLKIRGHRQVATCPKESEAEHQNKRLRVHLMEIDHGPFTREVELPENVDQDKIVANYNDGMLWIELPKK